MLRTIPALIVTVALLVAPLSAAAGGVAPAAAPGGSADAPPVADATLQEDASGELRLSGEQNPDDDTVVVSLSTTADDVAGYQANVSFDPSVVRVTSVAGAEFDEPITNVNNDEGWVFLTQSRANGTSAPTLARITFEIVGEAGSQTGIEFNTDDTLLNDGDAQGIDVEYATQSVSIVEGGELSADETTTTETATEENGSGGDGGLLSDPLLLGVGVGLGVAVLVGVGVVAGMRFGGDDSPDDDQ